MKNSVVSEHEKRNYKVIVASVICILVLMIGTISTAVYLEGVLEKRKSGSQVATTETVQKVEFKIDHSEIRQVFRDRAESVQSLVKNFRSGEYTLALNQPETVKVIAEKAYNSYIRLLCERNPMINAVAEAVKGFRAADIDFRALAETPILMTP